MVAWVIQQKALYGLSLISPSIKAWGCLAMVSQQIKPSFEVISRGQDKPLILAMCHYFLGNSKKRGKNRGKSKNKSDSKFFISEVENMWYQKIPFPRKKGGYV